MNDRNASSTIDDAMPVAPVEAGIRAALLLGVALVMLLPAARAYSPLLGWMPLWLVGMPAMAWWSLHRFCLPRRRVPASSARTPARRLPQVQARRRTPRAPRRLPRAA